MRSAMCKECAPLPQGTGGPCLLDPHWSTVTEAVCNCVLRAGMRGSGVTTSFKAWAFMCGEREAGGGVHRASEVTTHRAALCLSGLGTAGRPCQGMPCRHRVLAACASSLGQKCRRACIPDTLEPHQL